MLAPLTLYIAICPVQVLAPTPARAPVAPAINPAAQSASVGATLMVAAVDAGNRERAVADFRCDGSADQQQIQAALDALGTVGGSVLLSSGTFQLDAAVTLVGRSQLSGSGPGTVLRATSRFTDGRGLLDGVYVGTGRPMDRVEVSALTIDGNRFGGARSAGIHVDIRSKLGFKFGSPDAVLRLSDIVIARTHGDGLHVEGSFNRAARVSRVRVWDVEGVGFRIEAPDGNYSDCDCGSSGDHAFVISSANNHFTACKGWFADGDGFYIDAVRTTMTGCTAQDNEQHGYHIRAGMLTLSACHADSNSHRGGGVIPDPNRGLFDGFHIAASNVTLSSCFAYDKNEGQRGRNQRYGTYVSGTRRNLNLQVNNGNGSPGAAGSHDNLTGGVGGSLTGVGYRIVATGQDVFVTL